MTDTTTTTTTATTELIRTGKEAADSASKLLSSVKSAATLAHKVAREQLEQRPYATLGVAAGAGFVLAGGLASSLTRGIVSAGTKLAAAVLLDKAVTVLTGGGVDSAVQSEPAQAETATPDKQPSPQEFSELAAPH